MVVAFAAGVFDVVEVLEESRVEVANIAEDLPIERYTSREFFQQEVEKVWRKTWQMACRESQLRNPGDYFVYDIVDLDQDGVFESGAGGLGSDNGEVWRLKPE